jgi:predicted small secreted protein
MAGNGHGTVDRRMRPSLRTFGSAIAVVVVMAALAGCSSNTAQGVREDTTVIGDVARDTSARTVSVGRRAFNASARWLSSVLRGTGNALARSGDRLARRLDRPVK